MTTERTNPSAQPEGWFTWNGSPLWVPSPYRQHVGNGEHQAIRLEELHSHGFAFRREDLGSSADELSQGIVSTDRTMVVIFCDLIGSTVALLELRDRFRDVQSAFFSLCEKKIGDLRDHLDTRLRQERKNAAAQDETAGRRGVWPVLDKFMGDCAMFYVDCGNTNDPGHTPKCRDRCGRGPGVSAGDDDNVSCCATGMAMRLIHDIVGRFDHDVWKSLVSDGTPAMEGQPRASQPEDSGPPPPLLRRLGLRFGVALGDGVMLSVLGHGPEADFTVTGATVNLAARLEHATSPEFLDAIAEERASLERFASRVKHDEVLRGTDLWEKLRLCDEQVVRVHAVAQERFQIRANQCFVDCLRHRKEPFEMAWREVPFAARGFRQAEKVFLAGGGSAAELFSIA